MPLQRWLQRFVSRPESLAALAALALPLSLSRADTVIDLTTRGSSGALDGAIFSAVEPHPTGTGVIDPFLRLQAKGVEAGYNTNGPLEFDTKPSIHTHAIQLRDVPIVNVNGTAYREFFLDINESKPGTLLSLDQLKIGLGDSPTLSGAGAAQLFNQPAYNLDASGDNWVKLNYELGHGSGSGDMRVLIPNSAFGDDNSKYLYLYSQFGQNLPSDAGFEEWWVRKTDSSDAVPEPTTLAMAVFGAGGLMVHLQRRRKGATKAS